MGDDQVVVDNDNAAHPPNPSPMRIRVNTQVTAYPFPSTGSPTKEDHHPYGVKTTSTGILTRSNSSGMTPNTSHSYSPLASPSAPRYRSKPVGEHRTHRHSKSSSADPTHVPPSLPFPPSRSSSRSSSRSDSISEDEDVHLGPPQGLEESHMYSIRARRSETLPSLSTPTISPSFKSKNGSELINLLGLPENPKYWTPTNLSLYLGSVLSIEHGGTFSDPVVRDIQTTIINEKLSGRAFLRLNEDDLDDMGITPSWRDKFLAQAYLLRQKVIKGRIYGFSPVGDRVSPSTQSPEYSDAGRGTSLSISARSDRTSRARGGGGDQEVGGAKSGWIGRAVLQTSTSAPPTVGDPNSSFSTLSRQSIRKLNGRGMRVRGMVASYERSVSSDGNSSSQSDASELGDIAVPESDDRFFSTHENSDNSTPWDFSSEHSDVDSGKPANVDATVDAVASISGSPPQDAEHLEEHTSSLHSADVPISGGDNAAIDADSNEAEESHHEDLFGSELSLAHSSSPPGYYDDRSPPAVIDSDTESTQRIGAIFSPKTGERIPATTTVSTPLSLAVLEDQPDSTTLRVAEEEPSMEELLKNLDPVEEEEVSAHPWMDDDIIGQTARRITHHSSKKILRMASSLKSSPSQAKLPAALSSLFAPADQDAPSPAEPITVGEVFPLVKEVPVSTARVLVDKSVYTETAEEGKVEVTPSFSATDSLEFSNMLQVFRERLEEVERRLDELETREAVRVQEQLHAQLEQENGKAEGVFSGEVDKPAVHPASDHAVLEGVPVHASAVEHPEDSKQITHPKSETYMRIWDSKNVVDVLPSNLTHYVLAASLGVVVIIVQSVFRRFVTRRS